MKTEDVARAGQANDTGTNLPDSGPEQAHSGRIQRDLETLINSTNDLLWSLTAEFRLIAANTAFKQTFKALTSFIPHPGDNLLTGHNFPEAYLIFWKGVYGKALAGESFIQEVFVSGSDDVAEHWLEISFNPIFEAGEITGIACHSRNITERKIAAEQTRKSEAHLAEAQRLGKLGSWIFDFETDSAICSEELYKVFGVDKQTFVFTHNSYLNLVEEHDRALVAGSGRHTLATGESYTIEYRIITPTSEKRIVRENGFGQADTNGNIVRLFGTVQDITEQKMAEDKLKRSELNYLSLFEQATNAIAITTKSLDFVNVNPSACRSLGYSREELMQLPLTDLLFEDDITLNPLKTDEINAGDTVRTERRVRRKDGTAAIIEVSTRMLEDGHYLIFGHDISDRKQAEIAIIEKEARYRAFFENTIDGFLLSMTDGELIEANPAACAIFQMTEEEIGRAGKFGIFDATDVRIAPLMQQRRITGRAKGELTGIRKDGSRFPLEITSVVFTDAYGLERTSMIVRDITELLSSRKKTEESEKKYRQIVETAQEGIWLMDAGNQITFVNKKMCEILEYTEDEILGRTNLSFKDAAEQARALNYVDRRKKGIKESHETTFVTKSGRNIHTQVSATPVIDDQGCYQGTLAMITDITDRKRTEQEMLWLVNNTEESYILLDLNLHIISFNYQFRILYTRYLGISVSAGDSILDYASPDRRDALKETYMRVLQGNDERAEIAIPLPDNSIKNFAIKYKPAKDEQDVIIGVFVSVIDVTEKKKSEQELLVSERRFRAIVEHGADAIVILSAEGKPNYISPSIQRVLGYAESEAMQLDLFSRIHPDDIAGMMSVFEQVLLRPGETIPGHTGRMLHKDGTWRWLEATVTNMLHDPSINGIVDNFRDITEKKELENLLNKANSLARIGSWEVDLIKDTLYWSDITKEIHGVSPDFIPDVQTAIKFYKEGQSRDMVIQKMQDAVEKDIPFDVELQIIDARGIEKWVRALGEAECRNGKCIRISGSFQDIDARKRAELAVTDALQEKNIILESIGDAFFAVDKHWVVTYWNNHAAKILNKAKIDIVGFPLWEIFPGGVDSESYKKYHEAIATGQIIHFEDYLPHLVRWYEISAYPSDSGLSVYFKDVTARKLSEIRVHELNKDLRNQAKALAVSNSDLEQFAYVASHDLQEPLRMVTSFLAQLDKKYSHIIDDKGRKYIDLAIDGAKRMRLIILDLLEFSKIGRTTDSREDLDLNKLVADIQILFSKQIEESDATVEVDVLPVIRANKSPLRQVFQNLIGNALKYKKPGTPVRISITAKEEAAYWQFAIADNGIGIEEEYFEKIFVIFQRLHNKDEFSGTGMGLAITKKIIENEGGRISVASEAGTGSTFYFTILKEPN